MCNSTATCQICTRGVWDSTIPGIKFDSEGISNYAKLFDQLVETYPRGETGKFEWENIVTNVKKNGKRNKYDCIIGVSGGTDSSYLLHIFKELDLKPLAVNLDNGFNSDISVKNIKKLTSKLEIDLETYVINYEEIKDLLRSYIFASLPWIDFPTDLAIKASLYKIAIRENINFIFRGNDFRSEGMQPREWTYGDRKQLKYIHKHFGSVQLDTYPQYSFFQIPYYRYVQKIRSVYPYYYIDYNKKQAQKILSEKYNWEYYGGHHHENIFTRFAIAYWLPRKFNIDKRKITLSAQIMSGEISRHKAIGILKHPPYDEEQMQFDKNYILKKLDISSIKFENILKGQNKFFIDYPSYYRTLLKAIKIINPIAKKVLSYKPMALFQMEMRDNNI